MEAVAKGGAFPGGAVLVIKAWDRLGWLRPDKQTDLIAELLRTGIHIGICRLNDIFTEDDFGTHKWTTLAVFVQLAYQESQQKSNRIGASWQQRKKQTREGKCVVTTRLPGWLQLLNGVMTPIPERVAVVKRILDLTIAGQGHKRIVDTLLREKVSPFGERKVNQGCRRSPYCGRWTRPHIAFILTDRRAYLVCLPKKWSMWYESLSQPFEGQGDD